MRASKIFLAVSLAGLIAGVCGCGRESSTKASGGAPSGEVSSKPEPLVSVLQGSLPANGFSDWYVLESTQANVPPMAWRIERRDGKNYGAEVHTTGAAAGTFSFHGQWAPVDGVPVLVLRFEKAVFPPSQRPAIESVAIVPAPESSAKLGFIAMVGGYQRVLSATTGAGRADPVIKSVAAARAPYDKVVARGATLGAKPYSTAGSWKAGDQVVFIVQGSATAGSMWGSGPYTGDSHVARAAVHAGLVKDGEWGLVRAKFLPGADSYAGSTRNGVSSPGYGKFGLSMVLEKVE